MNNDNPTNTNVQSNATAQQDLQNFLNAAKLKITSYSSIPSHLAQELEGELKNLQELATNIAHQEEVIAQKNNIIIEKVLELKKSPLFPAQADVREVFEQAAREYHTLINEAIEEMLQKGSFFARHLAEGEKDIAVPATCSSEQITKEIEKRIEQEISFLKSYVKKRKKELAVFFSRYEHGFASHMQRLESIGMQIAYYNANHQK